MLTYPQKPNGNMLLKVQVRQFYILGGSTNHPVSAIFIEIQVDQVVVINEPGTFAHVLWVKLPKDYVICLVMCGNGF